jgi:hypothetical protein
LPGDIGKDIVDNYSEEAGGVYDVSSSLAFAYGVPDFFLPLLI